jgi:hypothetical protein
VGWWRLQRLKLLQLIDRLELAMVRGVRESGVFAEPGFAVVWMC